MNYYFFTFSQHIHQNILFDSGQKVGVHGICLLQNLIVPYGDSLLSMICWILIHITGEPFSFF